MPVAMSIEERRLRDLARACRSLEDGKALGRDLTKEARAVLNPTRNAARQAIRTMESGGVRHGGPKLRTRIAGKVMVQIRTGGRYPGAVLRAKKTPNVRKFRNAPKRTNSRQGWKHPAGPNGRRMVRQRGAPGWFDETTRRDRAKYRRAMKKVIEAHEKRLRSRL